MRRKYGVVLLIVYFAVTTSAFAGGGSSNRISVVGAVNNSTATDSSGGSWSADGIGIGGGVLFDLAFRNTMDFEIGGLYVERRISGSGKSALLGNYEIDIAVNGFEVPVGFRYWLANVFSLGAGVYYLHYTSASVAVKIGGASATASGTANGQDLGAYASAQFRIPMSASMSFLVDGRYNYGFKQASGDYSAKFQDIQGLVGLSFGI